MIGAGRFARGLVIPSVQALARWIDAHGYTSAGPTREVTLSCPDCGDHTVTELQEPVVRR